jgi:hypothetical protein
MKVVRTAPRELSEALGLGPALLERAAAEGAPQMTASVVRGPAVVLGAGQRAGRVVDLPACARAGTAVLRRSTAGTAAFVGERAIVWTLALPHVAALAPDATARTLLNRNVRGFLKGLSRAGAIAHYFGREWISVRQRPAALLGFEMTREGATLIEVFAGLERSIAIPEALSTSDERAVDRWLGKSPAGLAEVMGTIEGGWEELAGAVIRAVAARASAPVEEAAPITAASVTPAITRADDPMPEGFVAGPGVRVPIGWIDTGIGSGRVWLGGDVLVPGFALRAIPEGAGEPQRSPPIAIAVDGATLADLTAAAQLTSAWGSGRSTR